MDTRKAAALLAPRLRPDSEPSRARGARRRTLSVLNRGLGVRPLAAAHRHLEHAVARFVGIGGPELHEPGIRKFVSW